MKDTDASLRRHSYAYRSFFEVADQDYLSGRVLYRAGCLDQFLVMAQQCIEKYLKAILLFHDVKFAKSSHDLRKLLGAVEQITYVSLTDDTKECIKDLNQVEEIRYLTDSFGAHREDLFRLDKAVFELRIYCHSNQERNRKLASVDLLELRKANARRFFINSGFLGKVVAKRDTEKFRERYRALVWKNPWFGRRVKRRMRYTAGFWGKNTDLDLPGGDKYYEAIKDYVFLPKRVHAKFSASAKAQRTPSGPSDKSAP